MASEQHELIAAVEAAVAADASNVVLRLHLARLLIDAGRPAEALNHASRVLIAAPDDPAALAVVAEATAGLRPSPKSSAASTAQTAVPAADVVPDTADELFDQWAGNEPLTEVGVDGPTTPGVRLADIGGMEQVKQRIHASFLDPLRNPEIAARFGKTMRGGLLLWGPPGCGKTFIARALAGELGASFYVVGLNDVLEMWVGQSEQNLHQVFERARRSTPCVLFFDELDSIGQRRANRRTAGATLRNVVNLFLAELDGADVDNDGVFVLGATNHPWDVDSALLRPGRFDRTLLVLPPDLDAREAILRLHSCGGGRSKPSTFGASPSRPTGCRVPTSPSSASMRPSGHCPIRSAPARSGRSRRPTSLTLSARSSPRSARGWIQRGTSRTQQQRQRDVRRVGGISEAGLDEPLASRRSVMDGQNTAERVNALIKLRRFPEAADAARQGLATNPESAALNLLKLSIASCENGAFGEAVAAAERAVTLRPENAVAQRTLGWSTYKAGRADEAIKILERARASIPTTRRRT